MEVDFSRFYEVINRCYWDFFEDTNRIRLLFGGAGSGKSFYLTQEYIYKVVTQEKQNILVIRKVGATHRTSCFALFQQIIADLNLSKLFQVNKTDLTLTCKHNNNMIIFKGMDDTGSEKIKSITAKNGIITSIWVEEATEFTRIEDINQLNIRLRGESELPLQLTLSFNPISINHWIYKEFFQKKSFQKNYPVTILKTTYTDNKHIDDDYKIVLESYRDIDEQFYRVYCLGEFGVYGNVIFSNVESLVFPFERDQIDDSEILAGVDWGFNHPTALCLSVIRDGCLYTFDELIAYEATNKEYIDMIMEYNFISKNLRVVYDNEDPARGKEFLNYGFSFIPAKKGKGSVMRTIDYIKSFKKWYIDPNRCPRLLQEVEQYSWRVDKDGNYLDEPVNIMDDAIAAVRYSIEHLANMKGPPSILSGTKSDEKKKLIEIRKDERRKMKEVMKSQARKKREENKSKNNR